jgi:SRSO17 transposase
MKAAHVPEKTAFATKPALAAAMIERAIAAAVPFAFVAADSVYGVAGVERALRRAGKGYVLGVASNHSVNSWGKAKPVAGTAESVAQGLAPSDWKRLSAGDGAKGPRLYDWAYAELADIDASGYDASRSGLWTRGLLVRRTIAGQDLTFFSTWAPAGTSIEKLVRVEGCRWAIEDSFETAKNELGLDHNETRSWQGWNRHVSLVMLAFAMMATIRCRANKALAEPKRRLKIPLIRRLSTGPFRKSAASPQSLRRGASSQRAS